MYECCGKITHQLMKDLQMDGDAVQYRNHVKQLFFVNTIIKYSIIFITG